MKLKYVIVDWVDIVHVGKWGDRALAQGLKPAMCRTLGAVMRHDNKEIVLSSTVGIDSDEDESVMGVISIPVGCIRKIRRVKVA